MAKEKVNIDWGNVIKVGLTLFIITLICTLLLALTNSVTAPLIAEQNEKDNIAAQKQVLSEADTFEQIEDIDDIIPADGTVEVESVYEGFKGSTPVGYVVKTIPSGYGGDIELVTGITINGKLEGISILSQSETAGLGAKSTEPAFYEQFSGLDATEEVTVIKSGTASGNEIVAITGATITSNAVTQGVDAAIQTVLNLEGK